MKQNFLTRFNIQRITLERIDQESDTVRVEVVPITRDYTPTDFMKKIVDETSDNLKWWDYNLLYYKIFKTETLQRIMLLTKDELSENMVFWSVIGKDGSIRILHATQAARNLSKDLYSSLTETKKGLKEKT